MARSRMKFKPSLKESMRLSYAAQKFMAMGAPDEKREEAEARLNELFSGVDIDAAHHVHKTHGDKPRAKPVQREAPILAAVCELLAQHPKVLLAVRANSGMASYEAKSGKYAPVFFYRILTHNNLTLPDVWGLLKDGRFLAVECKAPPFKEPRNDREFRQANFLMLVRNLGGVALFATSADQVAEALDAR